MVGDATAAFLVGAGWAIILFVYGEYSSAGVLPRYEKTMRSAVRMGVDIAFIGGGTGVMLSLTNTYFSSFIYGLAGLVLGSIVATIGWR
jgi:hypothetical protein